MSLSQCFQDFLNLYCTHYNAKRNYKTNWGGGGSFVQVFLSALNFYSNKGDFLSIFPSSKHNTGVHKSTFQFR